MLKLIDKTAWSSYLRLLKYCKPYIGRLVTALGCMLIAAILNIIPPWLLKNVVDDVLIKKQMGMLNILAMGVVAIYFFKLIFNYIHMYLMTWVGQKVLIDIRLELYDRTQRLSMTTLYSRRSGEFLSRITNDVATLQNILANVVVELVVQGTTFVGILCFLFVINWKLMMVTFVVLPIAIFAIDMASTKLRVVGATIQERLAMVASIAQEALSSIRIVRSFATEEEEYGRFEQESRKHFKALMKGTQIRGALEGVVEIILVIALAFILWMGGRDVVADKMTAGKLLSFLTYIGLLVQPIRVLSRVISNIQQGTASADRVFEILDEQNEVPEPKNPVMLKNMTGKIEFDNVRFSYNKEKEVICGLNLVIAPGEKVAIVGTTGAGKSTIADLIMRFYDPQDGSIFIDGIDLKTLDLKTYRRQIGVVPQDPVLMKGTMAYNIGYGFPGVTEADLIKAAKIGGIYDFISTLPRGFNTEVGERGITLSGGQRQRIAIARAVVRDPRILIMDEATSSLDAIVEHQVQDAMRAATAGRTSIVIAHRLSTIRDSDRIIVLSEGCIAEQGTHEELISRNGHYRALYTVHGGEAAAGKL